MWFGRLGRPILEIARQTTKILSRDSLKYSMLHIRYSFRAFERYSFTNSIVRPLYSDSFKLPRASRTSVYFRAMASATSLDGKLANILKRTFPSADITATADPARLSGAIFSTEPEGNKPGIQYSDAEKAEINQWVITASHLGVSSQSQASL